MRKQTLGTLIVSVALLATALSTSTASASDKPVDPASVFATDFTQSQRPVKYPFPRPLPSFWDKLAQCETANNWQDGGTYAGGLGIYTKGKFPQSKMGTWERYGGEEFAPSPDKATREEQITVAHRIAITGYKTVVHRDPDWAKRAGVPVTYIWDQKPVGFTGWGCVKSKSTGLWRLGKPALVAHTPESVLQQKFKWGQKGQLVGDLQAILGVKQDFVYGTKTWLAHHRYIMANGKSRSLAPANPKLKRPSRIPKSDTKRCPQFEQAAYEAGFPKNQLSIVSYLMWKESRCVVDAVNKRDPKGGSRGLLQINGFWTKHLIKDGVIKRESDLFDPLNNLQAGFYVWTYSIENARYNYGWRPWNIW